MGQHLQSQLSQLINIQISLLDVLKGNLPMVVLNSTMLAKKKKYKIFKNRSCEMSTSTNFAFISNF